MKPSLLFLGALSLASTCFTADSYLFSVQAAGGSLHFTGALVGLHARVEP